MGHLGPILFLCMVNLKTQLLRPEFDSSSDSGKFGIFFNHLAKAIVMRFASSVKRSYHVVENLEKGLVSAFDFICVHTHSRPEN